MQKLINLNEFTFVDLAHALTERMVVNQQCNELAYVLEGEGKLVVNHEEHQLFAGDVVLIEAGEMYFWECNMKLFLSCRPA